METLRDLMRRTVKAVDKLGPKDVGPYAEAVRAALKERGLESGCHVGDGTSMKNGDDRSVEWYAGQFVDICDNSAWFAMNSFINCLDKFCPALDCDEEA